MPIGEPALLDQLEDHVERHQLGQRGRIAQVVGGALIDDAARVGVDHQHGVPAVHLRMGRRGQRIDRNRQRNRCNAKAAPWPAPLSWQRHSLYPTHERRPDRVVATRRLDEVPCRPSP